VEFPFLIKLNLASFCDREKFALSSNALPSLNELELNADDPFCVKIFERCQRESSTPIKRISIRGDFVTEVLEALLMVPVEELKLNYTWSVDIPWSEEKIITKTLKKVKWHDYFNVISSVSFLINCKQLESLELCRISSNVDFSPLSNLPLLRELSFESPVEEKEKDFLIKDLFRSAFVLPSLQKLELRYEKALSRFEGLQNILPNLRILESSVRVDEREDDENLLNSFLYLVRNFPKLEEIRFNGQCDLSSFKEFKPMNTRIPRLLKKEKPSLIIYYPNSCQYEPEPEKEGTRRDRDREESPPQQQKQKQKQTNTKKPRPKKAVPKKSTTTKKKRKAKVEKKKKPAGKKTAAPPKKKKIAPAKKAAKKKK
jgi:hypothetical protein